MYLLQNVRSLKISIKRNGHISILIKLNLNLMVKNSLPYLSNHNSIVQLKIKKKSSKHLLEIRLLHSKNSNKSLVLSCNAITNHGKTVLKNGLWVNPSVKNTLMLIICSQLLKDTFETMMTIKLIKVISLIKNLVINLNIS